MLMKKQILSLKIAMRNKFKIFLCPLHYSVTITIHSVYCDQLKIHAHSGNVATSASDMTITCLDL